MNLDGTMWGAIIAAIMFCNTMLTMYGNRLTRLNGQKTDNLHHEMNSMKDDLVAATDRAARAEGTAAGRAEITSEKKDK
jgi:SPX domain protein involved in polyphosphate accumulation